MAFELTLSNYITMKNLIALFCTLLLTSSTLIAQYDMEGNGKEKKKKKEERATFIKSLNFDYSHTRPANRFYCEAAGFNVSSLGMEVTFSEQPFWLMQAIQMKYALGVNGGMHFNPDVVQNVSYLSGYKGSFDVTSHRWEFYGGTALSYKIGHFLNVTIPVNAAFRFIGHRGKNRIYDDPDADPEQLNLAMEAAKNDNAWFGSTWAPGIRTGLELTWLPTQPISLYTRVNFCSYATLNVLDINASTHDPSTNEVLIPAQQLGNSSDWGISVGIKLNFGYL
jgi:hypothetical protein